MPYKLSKKLRWFYDRFYSFKRPVFTIPQMAIGYILYYLEYLTRKAQITTAAPEMLTELNITDSFDVLIDMSSCKEDPIFQKISSELLAIKQIQSYAFYWDQRTLYEEKNIFSKSQNDFQDIHSAKAEPTLEALYTANLLIKRHAHGRKTYLIDQSLIDELIDLRLDEAKYFFLVNDGINMHYTLRVALSLSACGCSLHERLALSRLCDGYLGSDKLLKRCASIILSLEDISDDRH